MTPTIRGYNSSTFTHAKTASASFAITGNALNGVIFGGQTSNPTTYINTFQTYTATSSTLTFSSPTMTGATLPIRYVAGIAGDATSGIIFGGLGRSAGAATYENTFHRYSISGNTATITLLTLSGTIAALGSPQMIGDANQGIIFGGFEGPPNSANNQNVYAYSVSASTVTVTTIGTLRVGLTEISATGGNGTAFLFGGNDGTNSVNDAYLIKYAQPT